MSEGDKQQSRLVGQSAAIRRVREEILLFSREDLPVLVQGPTGTGKELVAQELQQKSRRSARPFIAVDCGAIAETLLESELFGHKKGAFTSAYQDRRGRIEAAHEGTLFLDEVGELSLNAQAKLLRALQDKTVQRLGSHELVEVNVRVVTATNRNLEQAVVEESFRRDLFFRLNGIQIRLPPVRDRPEDIPLLAEHFCRVQANRKGISDVPTMDPEAVALLQSYEWPGNVRELQSTIDEAFVRSGGKTIRRDHLSRLCPLPESEEIKPAAHLCAYVAAILKNAQKLGSETPQKPQKRAIEQLERELIKQALEATEYNQTAASKLLGMRRATFDRKLRLYRLK